MKLRNKVNIGEKCLSSASHNSHHGSYIYVTIEKQFICPANNSIVDQSRAYT